MSRLLMLFIIFIIQPSVYAQVKPAVVPTIVNVETFTTSGKKRVSVAKSMGFVFESDGFILTAYANLTDLTTGRLLTDIEVSEPASGKVYPANIVGVEPTINLGILKIFAEHDLVPSKMVSRTGLQIGQEVYAATELTKKGSRYMAGRLVAMNNRECYQESLSSTMLRAELPLNTASIGSPIFNKAGEVVAIYTGYKAPVAEGHQEDEEETHILPSFLAMNIYESLKHKKSMHSPWTGFSVMPVDEKQRTIFPTKHGDKGGIAIEYVWQNSPAEKLGVKPGDILVRFGHYRIQSPADFQKWLYMYGVGHTVKLVFVRDLKEYKVLEYTIEERPDWAVPR